ncbi:MAG: ornithine cyclodeaminase family protein [Actinomycetota bacterium]|nr:ornithine cyclodeaminase family protein [Actinomycetota bacterium]
MDDLVYLTEADVRGLLAMPALRARLREAFALLSSGKADVPPRIAARAPHGLLAAMPGYVPGMGLVVKAVSVFAGNHGTDVPSHQGLIVVCDESNGTPVAVMDGASVTAIRTAASAAVAADLLARPAATVLAIIGGGVQGHSHLSAFADLRPWSSVRVASRSRGSAFALAARHPSGVVGSFEDAVRGADVICLTTDADHAVIEPEWVSPGAHVGSVGNRGELHPGFTRGTVFVEWMGAAAAAPPAGAVELQGIDLARVVEIGAVINGAHAGRTTDDEITVYKSTGHAVEDAAAARLVLDEAIAKGIGVRLPR